VTEAGFFGGAPPLHIPRRAASEQLAGGASAAPPLLFRPLPAPPGAAPYRLSLRSVIGDAASSAIAHAGQIAFHAVGDTGGVKAPECQEIVARWMERDCQSADPSPAFFYHLGDVVYYAGEAGSYYDQYYEPYAHYPRPIFAIPGNHDGDLTVPQTAGTLDAFMRNFCAQAPAVTPEARDVPRPAMRQPNCYWTLDAPFVTIIGLYTNCPEHGVVDDAQAAWFRGELAAADAGKGLIIALHHPPYSADSHHGASQDMRALLDDSFSQAGRTPDLVLTGHVHNYQRFTKPVADRSLTYIVAGAGGYWKLHDMAKVDGVDPPIPWHDPGTGVTLENYNREHRHGFLRLTVDATDITGVYTTVPNPQESWSHGPVTVIDHFAIPITPG
jgi:acid phosphatase type 7